MSKKSMFLCASVFALLIGVSAFAGAFSPESSSNSGLPSALSVYIPGCESSGTGDFYCYATVSGGSGSYNYWWMHTGSGQPYQDNTASASVTECVNGRFTFTVQVVDRVTNQVARSNTMSCACGEGFED